MRIYKIQKTAQEEYRDMHEAPDRESGAPLHDLTQMYPDDIYSSDAVRLYGSGESSDGECISIIQRFRNRPNRAIKVYRAIPDYNFDITKKINSLNKLRTYYYKFKFFPMNNAIVDELDEKYPHNQYQYDERHEMMMSDLENQIGELVSQKHPTIKINPGDWVTISRDYAKEHGMSNFHGRYKILSKTVLASQLFSEGNSIQEWGFIP
jgi:hypothetical protein